MDFYEELYKGELYQEKYLDQPTSSILPEHLLKEVGIKFNQLKKLIWISCNPVDVFWNGNYGRQRPKNINLVNDMSKSLIEFLQDHIHVLDLTNLTIEEVHNYTCDNIHLSQEGMLLIQNKLKNIIENDEDC